ncbi:MAG: alanine racemase [Clostridiales bacterium]|nr:alanine racemase [Clostridiales bacterium]
MRHHSRICAEINLDHFEHNLDEIKRLISPGTKVCAVIKTDGYGHGAIMLARMMEGRDEIWGYAVATVEEAALLRDAGVRKPVLILGYVFAEDLDILLDLDIRPTVFSFEAARELSDAAAGKNRSVKIHIKLDSGMGRIGLPCTEDSVETVARISVLPRIMTEGIFTHFARADEADKSYAEAQAERFFSVVNRLKARGIQIPICHISNSAGIIDLPQYNEDMVRAGIILYGLWPSDEVQKERIDLRPLMTLKSHVVHVKMMRDGDTIGYGGTYRVCGSQRIATIPVGYGDGYPRALSNRGYVLIRGKKAPICGRICMDQFMVNVTEIPEAVPGDEVILLGKEGSREITMEELGTLSGRFNYEFACDVGRRVPRIYYREGKAVEEYLPQIL